MAVLTRDSLAALDRTDPIAHFRDQFVVPEGVLYLDGNSLGALPKSVEGKLAQVIGEEWGNGLVRSWNTAGWIDMPRRVGDKIAKLIGARPGEVIVADSTSVNLFKVLVAALNLNPDRRVILSESDNFPTDLYIAQGLINLLGGKHELRLEKTEPIKEAIDENTAVVMLT